MRILLTNDDGIYAPGLWALASALKEIGEVVIVAPDREQSGVGASITLHNPVRLQKIKPLIEDIEAYSVEGTPADSVILAIRHLIKEIDVVVSGINEGANLGNDVFVSGTVGAAFQGYFYGLPSLALSVAAFGNIHLEPATKLAITLVKEIKSGSLPREILLNINLPNLPLEEIKGIEITRLGKRIYTDVIEEGFDGKRKYYWIVREKAVWETEPGTDVWAIKMGKISITPLGNFPNSLLPTLKELLPKLFSALFL